jgi:hypothetical protein
VLRANVALVAEHGWQAAIRRRCDAVGRDGYQRRTPAWQAYVVFKSCEHSLVHWLTHSERILGNPMKIAILPGDGIGTEIVAEAVKVLNVLDLKFETETALVGGAAFEAHGHPLPESTLNLAKAADAMLFGAVGDWKYDKLERPLRPEQAILGLRKHLGLFANFRPALCYEQLTHASSLKPELVAGLDILIIRELTGDIYFGQPRGRRTAVDGHFPGAEEAFDTMRYSRPEIERIAHVAFQAARKRSKKVTSVDKANVLETFQFWKDVVTEVHAQYPDVELEHMYVDNAAMQLVKAPKKPSTWWSPATCSATSCRTRRPCSPARSACCPAHRWTRTTRACTSPATAARPTSPVRELQTRWLQSCPLP